MFCKNCGEQIDGNSKYCNNCGAQIIKDKKENLEQDYYNEPVMNIPEGCAACGGLYPNFKWSCLMFDD